MGQEFFINSEKLESKVRQLLPSQGGRGANQDLSASTQIVPIIDLTESAEGSNLRQDLQTSFGFDNTTAHNVTNTSTVIINTTGYFTVEGNFNIFTSTSTGVSINFSLSDGSSSKTLKATYASATTASENLIIPYKFNVFISAGDSLTCSASANCFAIGSSRQIADINGVLTPLP